MDTEQTKRFEVVVKHEFVGPEGWRYLGRVLGRLWAALMMLGAGAGALGAAISADTRPDSKAVGNALFVGGALGVVALMVLRVALEGLLVERPKK